MKSVKIEISEKIRENCDDSTILITQPIEFDQRFKHIRRLNKKSSSRSNENCKGLELRCVYRFALRNHPSIPTFETSLRNAKQHRNTVFVSFIVVLVIGFIWILIRRRGVDENGNENIILTYRFYGDYRSSPI